MQKQEFCRISLCPGGNIVTTSRAGFLPPDLASLSGNVFNKEKVLVLKESPSSSEAPGPACFLPVSLPVSPASILLRLRVTHWELCIFTP